MVTAFLNVSCSLPFSLSSGQYSLNHPVTKTVIQTPCGQTRAVLRRVDVRNDISNLVAGVIHSITQQRDDVDGVFGSSINRPQSKVRDLRC